MDIVHEGARVLKAMGLLVGTRASGARKNRGVISEDQIPEKMGVLLDINL